MRNVLMFAIALFIGGFGTVLATAQQLSPDTFESNELIETGHKFFGTVSRSLAGVIEKAVSQWGLPNGYVLGQEAGAAVVAGCVTGTVCSIPRMLATCGFTGRVLRSVGISAATASAL
jgi:hypothetical protein